MNVAAALTGHALSDGRGVGMEAVGVRRAVIAADRGVRQRHKILGLLAVAEAEGSTPLVEMLLESAGRARRGMVVVVVTPSLDASWVRPLAALRGQGMAPVACLIDPLAHLAARGRPGRGRARCRHPSASRSSGRCGRCCTAWPSTTCARTSWRPDRPLGEQLVAGRGRGGTRAA